MKPIPDSAISSTESGNKSISATARKIPAAKALPMPVSFLLFERESLSGGYNRSGREQTTPDPMRNTKSTRTLNPRRSAILY